MAQPQSGPKPPRAPKLSLGRLSVAERSDLDGEDDLDEVELRGHRTDVFAWTSRRGFTSSMIAEITADTWSAEGCSLSGSAIANVEILKLEAPGSGWWNTEITDSRLGSAQLYDATLRNVAFARCKISYLNLRGASLRDVVFTDCVIAELDLAMAKAARVAFSGCRIDRIEAGGASLSDVDLRRAHLAGIASIDGLRGASISLEQLFDLAPAMAQWLGLRVE